MLSFYGARRANLLLSCALVLLVSHVAVAHSGLDGDKYTPEAQADHVPSLPGWGEINEFKLFSGYVTVDEDAGRSLFYAFAESMSNPDKDPLILWNNGGPGCSSLGGGFMSELGPFLPLPGGKQLQKNDFAWNNMANVIFLESPAFVGFSYSNTSGDRVVGDARTAVDSRAFMLGFLERFPHLRGRDFFLSGESYGGHYIPNLALEIVNGNEAAKRSGDELSYIALRGFILGNAWTDASIDNEGTVDFWWHHALISDTTLAGIKDNCDFSIIGPLQAGKSIPDADAACDEFCDQAMNDMGNINIYEIFADVCIPAHKRKEVEHFAELLKDHPAGLGHRVAAQSSLQHTRSSVVVDVEQTPAVKGSPAELSTTRKLLALSGPQTVHLGETQAVQDKEPAYDPCVDNEVEMYLNTPAVQKALHANQTHIIPGRWVDCSRAIIYSREDLLTSMLPVYEQLLQAEGLRLMVYSGDVDGIVPVVGTRRWIATLDLEETEAWRPWYSETKQVGGYVVEYGNFTFATVRNAGHMAPYTQPERMFHMVQRFLLGSKL